MIGNGSHMAASWPVGGTTSGLQMDDIPHRDEKVVVSLEEAGGGDFAE
jgi:hypothetical protein